jgi:hypothetical protein
VGVEVAPRRSFAVVFEWPGWCRSGRTEQEAIDALLEYEPRYGSVARRAGCDFGGVGGGLEVAERVPGTATTEFGAPGARYAWDDEVVESGELRAAAALLVAAWSLLDEVVAAAPAELRKGPRGGGRDRDAIAAHVRGAEVEYGRKLGLERWNAQSATAEEVTRRREAMLAVLLAADDGAPRCPTGWPLRTAARRCIWHVLDHAWEIEDRSS